MHLSMYCVFVIYVLYLVYIPCRWSSSPHDIHLYTYMVYINDYIDHIACIFLKLGFSVAQKLAVFITDPKHPPLEPTPLELF